MPGLSTAHFEVAKGTDSDQKKYCSKDGIYKEWGSTGEDEKTVYEEVFDVAKYDLRAAIEANPELAIKHFTALRSINNFYTLVSSRDAEQSRYDGCRLRSWQQKALDTLVGQNDREILFCVDIKGGAGKSWFAKYLLHKYDAWGCQGGPIKDLMYSYACQPYCVFDMARCNDEKFFPWNFMENLKNGWFLNIKYESRMVQFEPPKVIVMMNQVPMFNKFSMDRYCILMCENEQINRYT